MAVDTESDQFKKAMKEMNFDDITDRELAAMFSHLVSKKSLI